MNGKMYTKSSIVMMFLFKHLSLQPVHDSVPGFTYTLDIAITALQKINQIIALTITKYYGVIGYVVIIHYSFCSTCFVTEWM